jgi:hypothetical protein
MSKTKTLSLSKFISIKAQELGGERREFFLNWLANHTGLEKQNAEKNMEKELNTWFYSLSIGQALAEHKLIIAEISWCSKISIQTLRRIASTERLDDRRSLDE